jgi:hypothetical protein
VVINKDVTSFDGTVNTFNNYNMNLNSSNTITTAVKEMTGKTGGTVIWSSWYMDGKLPVNAVVSTGQGGILEPSTKYVYQITNLSDSALWLSNNVLLREI